MASSPYKYVGFLPEAREALESLAVILIGKTHKRLTFSEVIIEAERIIRDSSDDSDIKSS